MNYAEQEAVEKARFRKTITKIGTAVALGLFTLLTACNGFYSNGERERAVHTRFGAVAGVTGPGLHFKVPFIDGVKRMGIEHQTVKWAFEGNSDSRMTTYSKDQQPAKIAVTVVWYIDGDERTVKNIYRQYGGRDNLWTAIVVPSTTEAFKNVFGTYDAVSAIQNRERLNAQATAALEARVKGTPVRIASVQVQDIEFSKAYEDAVEARMTAQVEVQKAEQNRQTKLITSEMLVIEAEANAKKTRLAGEAEAAAIRARSDALRDSPRLVELTLAERWDGKLPTTMVPNQGVPLLNVR